MNGTIGGMAVVIIIGYLCAWSAYLLGRKHGRYIERRKVRSALCRVPLEGYSPAIRLAMILVLNDIKSQLEKEWKA